jgi:hypothetical protein
MDVAYIHALILMENSIFVRFQSFAERLTGLMARPGQDNVPKDDVPWHLKYGGRACGIIGGFCKYHVHENDKC